MNRLFRALNDDTRRRIIDLLKDKDMNAGEIADHFDMSKPSISHHLDLLKQANLVQFEKRGQFIVYSLNTTVLDDVISWFMDLKSNDNEADK